MKTSFLLFVVLCLTAGAASAATALVPVSFVTGKHQFKAGDSLVIDQVLATSPNLEVGSKVTVRGHYQLASTAKAKIGLFITHRAPADVSDSSAPSQIQQVSGATGAFELSCDITYAGDLHVSFYPATSGEAFGGVYFFGPTR